MQNDAKEGKLRGFALPVSARLHVVSKHREISSPNVAGVLRGSDASLAGEYVVYTAHTDHLGIGGPINGDAIYNGAVDDASGTSALIEMAKAFATLSTRPARSILFLAVTAEEKGLLGSDYFAHYPTVPAGSLVADINMDGASVFNGPIRSVCVKVCFSPDGRMVHAGPLHTPSMYASRTMASRWDAMSAAGLGRSCAGANSDTPTIITRADARGANDGSRCLNISVLLN